MVRYLKNLSLLLCLFVLSVNVVSAGSTDISAGIEAYQAGKYQDCISVMKSIVKQDPTSVVGYYYLAIAYSKTGNKSLAVENYNKVINLGCDKTLSALAKKGKSALEVKKVDSKSEAADEKEDDYNPIMNDVSELNPETKSKQKTVGVIKASDYSGVNDKGVNNKGTNNKSIKKDTTHNSEPAKFEFDPSREPTNDEIVNAIKILQKAGLLQNGAAAITGTNNQNQYQQNPYQYPNQMPQMDSRTQQMYSMMQMMNNGNNNSGMMNMMPYMNNGGKLDPQMIKMMMMQQMMPNFSNGNNNGGY